MNQTPPQEADWAAQVVDSLESVIAGIRSKTSEPLSRIVRSCPVSLLTSRSVWLVPLLTS